MYVQVLYKVKFITKQVFARWIDLTIICGYFLCLVALDSQGEWVMTSFHKFGYFRVVGNNCIVRIQRRRQKLNLEGRRATRHTCNTQVIRIVVPGVTASIVKMEKSIRKCGGFYWGAVESNDLTFSILYFSKGADGELDGDVVAALWHPEAVFFSVQVIKFLVGALKSIAKTNQ